MSGTRNLEENLVLPLELDLLVVDPPRQIHGAVSRNELVPAELRARFTLRARLGRHVNEDSRRANEEGGRRKWRSRFGIGSLQGASSFLVPRSRLAPHMLLRDFPGSSEDTWPHVSTTAFSATSSTGLPRFRCAMRTPTPSPSWISNR